MKTIEKRIEAIESRTNVDKTDREEQALKEARDAVAQELTVDELRALVDAVRKSNAGEPVTEDQRRVVETWRERVRAKMAENVTE